MIESRQTKSSGLADRLRAELLAGQYPSGSPVASVRELARRYGISTVTADKILRQLVKEDFLYRVPQSGTFIKHDPPPVPVIGYGGYLPPIREDIMTDNLLESAFRHLQDYLAERDIELHIVPYHELRHKAQAEKRLKHLNGLLLSSAYVDDATRPALWQFSGRIVIVGDTHIIDRLPCSQIIPDYTDALRKLSMKYDLDFYKRILILSAGHPNAVASERQIREILPILGVSAEKIESLNLPCVNNLSAQMAALRHFSSSIPDFANTLLISLSDYFSRGILEVFRGREEEMPDLLSIDNLEDYDTAQEEKSFLTAIDRRLPDIYEEGVRLLTRLITEKDECSYLVRIPARLVVRNSIKQSGKSTTERR